MGELIEFPKRKRTRTRSHPPVEPIVLHLPVCDDCEHAMFGTGGITCRFYEIDVEPDEAEDCEQFTPTPWAGTKGTGANP